MTPTDIRESLVELGLVPDRFAPDLKTHALENKVTDLSLPFARCRRLEGLQAPNVELPGGREGGRAGKKEIDTWQSCVPASCAGRPGTAALMRMPCGRGSSSISLRFRTHCNQH